MSFRRGMLRLDIANSLSSCERDIFELLLSAARAKSASTTIRVAGGWVRDKLLGLESDDIDIAVDDCSGVAFAAMVNDHLQSQGQNVERVAVIHANPEQSKHLETARMKIFDQWIDFVNLRTESYGDSRIPDMAFGTAMEDSLRRDFTINALFYNLNAKTVEDFTKSGIGDLKEGIVRTPLPASATFDDDPLRVLRAVRFAARFGFKLHEDIICAGQSRKVHSSLLQKVSRERMHLEIEGMLAGKMAKPSIAVQMLDSLDLLPCIFVPPPNMVPESSLDWSLVAKSTNLANAIIVDRQMAVAVPVGNETTDECPRPARQQRISGEFHDDEVPEAASEHGHRLFYLCTMLLPFVGRTYQCKGKTLSVVSSVMQSLKFKNKDVADVDGIFESLPVLVDMSRLNCHDRVKLGMVLRQLKDLWKTAIDVAMVHEMCSDQADGKCTSEDDDQPVVRYKRIKESVQKLNLERCWDAPALMNGKQLISHLGLKPGPIMGKVLQEQVKWQLGHPDGSKEECAAYLASVYADLEQNK